MKTIQHQADDNSIVLKTPIGDYDAFFQLQNDKLKVELLSRQEARIYKCTIDCQNIPKCVYSFIPTPVKLYDEISYIISNHILGRLDVIDTNFIYRASINQKNQQVLIDGVFQTHSIMQNDLQRIQDLIDIRTSALSQDLTMLKLQFGLLKKNLEYNGIILEMPIGFCANKSNIIITDTEYITLCKFFTKKIYKIDMLYRASENNFQIKKFHQKCDNIPNTLTVILTEYDKKIGGFTPLPWDKNGNDKFLTDYQNRSFIFSLTNSHKFTLQQTQFATKITAEDGPRFGNGADLVIKDKANQNNNSYANICTSYFHPRYTYKSVQSYERFSGDEKTNRFGIKQWEVYQVFFEE